MGRRSRTTSLDVQQVLVDAAAMIFDHRDESRKAEVRRHEQPIQSAVVTLQGIVRAGDDGRINVRVVPAGHTKVTDPRGAEVVPQLVPNGGGVADLLTAESGGKSLLDPWDDSALYLVVRSILALRLHQEFSDRKAATRFVRDFALSQGKRAVVNYKTSGGNNFTLQCASETQCSFFVKMAKSRARGVSCLRVMSFNAKHDGCTGSAKATCDQVVRFASASSAVTAQPSISAAALISQIQAAEGVALSKRMAYRARDAVREEAEGNVLDGFASVQSLLSNYSTKNGGAFTDVQVDCDGRFVRAFLSHPFLKEHCENGQRIYGIDGTFMKHGQYPSVMLVLIGRDGNNKNIPVGVGICDGETSTNAEWFLSCCEEAGVNFNGVPVFTDRGKALLSALSNRPEAVVRYCTRHIIGNVINKFGAKIVSPDVQRDIWALQSSESKEEFTSRLAALSASHKLVADYLGAIDENKWVLFTAIGKTQLYGWRTTNFVESENGAAVPARFMHAFGLFNHYIERFMDHSVASAELAEQWRSEGNPVTEYAKKLLDEQAASIGYHKVRKSCAIVAFVHDTRSIPKLPRRVDIAARTCTCPFMNQYGVPCRHMLSALKAFNQSSTVFEKFERCYMVDNYDAGYSASASRHIELVLPEDLEKNASCLPPSQVTGRGRKRTERIPIQGESSSKKRGGPASSETSAPRKCSKCQGTGHNRRTCDA